jgi:hypothetical protein
MRCQGGRPSGWLTLAAGAACCAASASACTVYDLFSSGLASSLWHMIPAVGLMADNGTFFVAHSPSNSLDLVCWFGSGTVTE